MSASDYTEVNLLNSLLRGVAFPVPAGTWVGVHTAEPPEPNNVVTEVQTSDWPSYARVSAEQGGAIGSGWTVPAENTPVKQSKNAKILAFPSNNGAGTVTLTHFSVWDAPTGGNMLNSGQLGPTLNIASGAPLVFDANSLTITMA